MLLSVASVARACPSRHICACTLGAMAGNPRPALCTPELYEGSLASAGGPFLCDRTQSSPCRSAKPSARRVANVPLTELSLKPVFSMISDARIPGAFSISSLMAGLTVPLGARSSLSAACPRVTVSCASLPRDKKVVSSRFMTSRSCARPASYASSRSLRTPCVARDKRYSIWLFAM